MGFSSPASRPRFPISSNTTFQTAAVLAVLGHIGVLVAVWPSPGGCRFLLSLNAFVGCAVLLYAAGRARSIWTAGDRAYAALIAFELLVLAAAFFAFRGSRVGVLGSCFAFGLHGLASLAAAIFAFGFKMRMM